MVVLAALTGATLWSGHALTAPANAPTLPPRDLSVQPLSLSSASGATLGAWFLPGVPGAGAVLLLHGVRSNKQSMLGRARFLKSLGLSVLLVDLQAHGESAGERITFGHREARDVEAATVRLMQLAPGERIGALGVSLGAAAMALARTKEPYSAVVLESLYATLEDALDARLRLHAGPIGPCFAPLLLAQLGPRLGVPTRALRPIDHVGEFAAPVLLVHGETDRHTPIAEARRVYAAIQAPKSIYVVPGAAHIDLHAYAGLAYEVRIGSFLVAHLRGLPPSATGLSSLPPEAASGRAAGGVSRG